MNELILIQLNELFVNLTSKKLLLQFCKNIFLNFDIWIYTSFDLQKKLLSILQSILFDNRQEKFNIDWFTIKDLIQIFQFYYCIKKEEKAKELSSNIMNNGNDNGNKNKNKRGNEIDFKKTRIISKKELIELRGEIINLIDTMIFEKKKIKNVKNIIYLLITIENKNENSLEILKLINKILNKNFQLIINYILNYGSIYIFLPFLKRKNPKIRETTLEILYRLQFNQHIKNINVKNKLNFYKEFELIQHFLSKNPFTIKIYNLLFSFLIQQELDLNNINFKEISIKKPIILKLLFKSIKKSIDENDLQFLILIYKLINNDFKNQTEIKMLFNSNLFSTSNQIYNMNNQVKNHSQNQNQSQSQNQNQNQYTIYNENIEAIIQHYGWQKWFFETLDNNSLYLIENIQTVYFNEKRRSRFLEYLKRTSRDGSLSLISSQIEYNEILQESLEYITQIDNDIVSEFKRVFNDDNSTTKNEETNKMKMKNKEEPKNIIKKNKENTKKVGGEKTANKNTTDTKNTNINLQVNSDLKNHKLKIKKNQLAKEQNVYIFLLFQDILINRFFLEDDLQTLEETFYFLHMVAARGYFDQIIVSRNILMNLISKLLSIFKEKKKIQKSCFNKIVKLVQFIEKFIIFQPIYSNNQNLKTNKKIPIDIFFKTRLEFFHSKNNLNNWQDHCLIEKLIELISISKILFNKNLLKNKDSLNNYYQLLLSLFTLLGIGLKDTCLEIAQKMSAQMITLILGPLKLLRQVKSDENNIELLLLFFLFNSFQFGNDNKNNINKNNINKNNIHIDELKNENDLKNQLILTIIKSIILDNFQVFQLIFTNKNNKKLLGETKENSILFTQNLNDCLTLFQSSDCKRIIATKINPSLDIRLKELGDQIENYCINLIKQVSEIIFSFQKQKMIKKTSIAKMEHKILQLPKNLKIMNYITQFLNENKLKQRINEKNYNKIIKRLFSENSCWSNKDFNNKTKYWKIDKFEDNYRKRLRFKRNYHAINHQGEIKQLNNLNGNNKKIKTNNNNNELIKNDHNYNKIKNNKKTENEKEKESENENEIEIEKESESESENDNDNENENEKSKGIKFDKKKRKDSINQDELKEFKKIKKNLLTIDCIYISPMKKRRGKLNLSTISLDFYLIKEPNKENSTGNNSSTVNKNTTTATTTTNKKNLDVDKNKNMEIYRIWYLDQIVDIQKRLYYLTDSAIEIFLLNKKSIFLVFDSKSRNKIIQKILNLKPKNLQRINHKNYKDLLKKSNYTKMWQRREISNFDYLMKLNTIAGRTYNDLSQYPIFPWILNNYRSKTIDLNDPKVYRDLSKPIGALNEKRLDVFENRYQSLTEIGSQIPPFHYGTHYSNFYSVLFYLIRLEPFSTFSVNIQGGKFDRADRLFNSIELCWFNCLNLSADVKELIPEFYYLPEFLQNSNKFNFGQTQKGEKVDDVILPPWANGSPEEFIRIMREALESDYVSAHLNEWIDLIFGYKQRGEESIKAKNVFYYLTYQEHVDLDQIKNPQEREGIENQIESFGQCPIQLFTKAHPIRMTKKDLGLKDYWTIDNFSNINMKSWNITKNQLLFISSINSSSFICLDSFRHLLIVHHDSPNTLSLSKSNSNTNLINNSASGNMKSSYSKNENENENENKNRNKNTKKIKEILNEEIEFTINFNKKIGCAFSDEQIIFTNCFVYSHKYKLFFTSGFCDHSFKIFNIENTKLIQSVVQHYGVVTCLNVHRDYLATGSTDITVKIWKIGKTITKPYQILYGHNDQITCVNINQDLDIVVSGSKNGNCLIHSLRTGKYYRNLTKSYNENSNTNIKKNLITSDGKIIVYQENENSNVISCFSINGKLLFENKLKNKIIDFKLNFNHQFLICILNNNTIQIHKISNFGIVYKTQFQSLPISLSIPKSPSSFFVALKNGKIVLIIIPQC
ncbi:beige/beach-related [Anaeramoeba flamelloides]|uniref:Beige/beach-related n=1 Tax=Anaeramoeba flamelloides TaxID=1746091 RepID=A0ABQ8YVW7_9EUKA|nr:beige/beach-related [Anaeramoeba flamelloides]